MTAAAPAYPRLRDLPPDEREAFARWLRGHTRPVDDPSAPQDQWDWYYPWDYAAWRAGSREPQS